MFKIPKTGPNTSKSTRLFWYELQNENVKNLIETAQREGKYPYFIIIENNLMFDAQEVTGLSVEETVKLALKELIERSKESP
jgi:site-specific recombinase XerD